MGSVIEAERPQTLPRISLPTALYGDAEGLGNVTERCGLPQEAIPVSKLESGARSSLTALAGPQSKPGQRLATTSTLEPVDDIRVFRRAPHICWRGGGAWPP